MAYGKFFFLIIRSNQFLLYLVLLSGEKLCKWRIIVNFMNFYKQIHCLNGRNFMEYNPPCNHIFGHTIWVCQTRTTLNYDNFVKIFLYVLFSILEKPQLQDSNAIKWKSTNGFALLWNFVGFFTKSWGAIEYSSTGFTDATLYADS